MTTALITTALSTMWDKIKRFFAPPIFEGDEDKTRIAGLLNTLVVGMLVILGAGFIVGLVITNQGAIAIILGLHFLMTVISKSLLQWGRPRPASIVFIIGLWITVALIYGLSAGRSSVIVFFAALVVIAGLLLGQRAAITSIAVSSLMGFGMFVADKLNVQIPVVFLSPPLANWIMLTFGLIFLSIPLQLTLRDLTRSVSQARTLAAEANRQREQLAVLVDERTRDLMRNTNYLNATTAVANEAAAVRGDPVQLLHRVVGVISRQFDFYQTGLFLLDPRREWVELRAASSEGGQRLVAQSFRLRLAEGMVGDVAQQGRYRLAQDVQQDAAFRPNPDLPDTRAELALPLRVRGEVTGVLDVQSTQPNAFHEEDVSVLQALADQVAIAINNAQLLRQVEESAEAERRAFGQISQEAWRALLGTQKSLGFVSDQQGLAPAGDLWEPQMKTAAQTGPALEGSTLAIPIKVRDQVIGVIDGLKPQGAAWTQDEIALLQTMTDQLSTALESARLYQDTQRRAARERLLREISDQMQGATDMEALMHIAAEELNKALGSSRAYVRLGTEALQPPNGDERTGEGDD
jgi:GAF domain-containing protein